MATVIVNGLNQIQRDLAKSGPRVERAVQAGLRQSAEPVARLAKNLALTEIRRMPHSPQWAETRIGVTRNSVYIVPKQRGVRVRGPDPRRRPFARTKTGGPSFGELMLGRAFAPAMDVMEPVVQAKVDALLQGVISSLRGAA